MSDNTPSQRDNSMYDQKSTIPRDKKKYHRSTSDVESDKESGSDSDNGKSEINNNLTNAKLSEEDLELERKIILKQIILKRNIAMREQRNKKP